MNEPAIINTDGACSGNPGPGGFAAIIEVGQERITVTGGDPQTTNNRMELAAVIEALRTINSLEDLRHSHVTVRSDSQYIVNAFNNKWIESWQKRNWRTAKKQPVLNQDLWHALLKEIEPHQADFVWVRGHAGDPMNEECDSLAVEQAKHAPSEGAYWVSAGNPKTAAVNLQHQAAVTGTLQATSTPSNQELLMERSEIALNAARKAIALLDDGNTEGAREQMAKTIRHLEAQNGLMGEVSSPALPYADVEPSNLPF